MALGNITGGIAGGATVAIVIKAIDNYSSKFKQLQKDLKKQTTSLGKLNKVLAFSGIGYSALAIAATSFGVEATKAAMKMELAQQQFNLQLGETADIMMTDLRKASQGMVSDFELINSANRALALGIDQNQLPKLLESATARAKVMGITTTQAFNDIATGVGRQSRLILDNLGIIIDLEEAYKEYSEETGVAVDAMDDFQKKTAMVNAILKDTEGLMFAQQFLIETHTEKVQRLTAKWENFKTTSGGVLLALFDIGEYVGKVQYAMFNWVGTMTDVQETLDDIDSSMPNFIKKMDEGARVINDLYRAQENARLAAEGHKKALQGLKDMQLTGMASGSSEVARLQRIVTEVGVMQSEGAGRQAIGQMLGGEGFKSLSEVEKALEQEQGRLDLLRLQREEQYLLGQAQIEERENNEITLQGLKQKREEAILGYDAEIDKAIGLNTMLNTVSEAYKTGEADLVKAQDIKIESWKGEQQEIENTIEKVNELISKYKKAATARASSGTSSGGIIGSIKSFFTRKVGDAIIRPNGEVIETHPQDTLIATKNPGGMGTTIIFNVEGSLVDAEGIDKMLSDKLGNKLSL